MEKGKKEVEKMMQEFEELKRKYKILKEVAKVFRVKEEDLPRVIERFKKELEEMRKLSQYK
jgi:DNA-binding PadR family transcriptional regulator